MMINNKIQDVHTSKLAYVYLRQSTMGQVRFNQESTERQYALQNKAHQLGWQKHNIKILDGDLGLSGTQSHNREDFKSLVANVSMGKVGAVFSLEASRLSRSCADWHRLLELCALTSTLIIDEDGCYNPADFNDQLLLGIKGTMSQAELHFIRARLLGGKKNKAKKGELKFPLPVGFYYDDEGKIVFDPDEQVRSVITQLFKAFREKGSAYGVMRYFAQHHILFPKRAYGGIWKGKLIWSVLTHSRILGVLKNPSYAGVYVYGRYKYQKKLSAEGKIQSTMTCLPMDQWEVVIKDHHEAYITWDDYLRHRDMLTRNQTNTEENMLPTAAREGLALLQGLLVCGHCGHRITVRYTGNGGLYPCYLCNWKKREGLATTSCLSVRCDLLDNAISQKVLAAMNRDQIDISIKAFDELAQRNQAIERQWQMKITRADYDAQLAQKCYEAVDPENRLVAATLEKRWDEALTTLEETRAQFADYQKKNPLASTSEQKNKLMSLVVDLPRLWNAKTTHAKDRKRILRLFIKDITVNKIPDSRKVVLSIRWQGGANESLDIALPRPSHERWQHPPELINRVNQLAKHMTDEQIAKKFNQEKLKTNKGNAFTINSIQWIRHKHKIPSPRLQRPGELSVNEVAAQLDVSHHVVRYWIERGIISPRRIGSRLWISMSPEKDIELRQWVKKSTRIAKANAATSQKEIEGGVV